jgi:hypothetical protein
MYWQPDTRKFGPLSAAITKTVSSIEPIVPPAVRVSEIVALGKVHDATPPSVSANCTGTTPRVALNTLEPSALIGC